MFAWALRLIFVNSFGPFGQEPIHSLGRGVASLQSLEKEVRGMERRIDGVTAIAPVDPVNPRRVNPKGQKKDPRKNRPWDDVFREHFSRDEGREDFRDEEDALQETFRKKKKQVGPTAWNPAWQNVYASHESAGDAPSGRHVYTTA
jgi:hypothetical protein